MRWNLAGGVCLCALVVGLGVAAGATVGAAPRPRDLPLMAVQPRDLAGATKPIAQGYVRDPEDVAQYVRAYRNVSVGSASFSALSVYVELKRSSTAAETMIQSLRVLLGSARGRATLVRVMLKALPPTFAKAVRTPTVTPIRIPRDNQALAWATKFRVAGQSFASVISIVRRGPIVERLALVSAANEPIPRVATRRLAGIAAARIDQTLRS